MPAPIEFQSVRIAIDLDRNVMCRAGLKDLINVHVVTRSSQQQAARDVPEDAREWIGQRLNDAVSLLNPVAAKTAVHTGYNEIEGGENVVRIVERTIGEDIGLDALQDAKATAESLVQHIHLVVLT